MDDEERSALERVLAAARALATGEPVESALERVCEAALALGASGAWVRFRETGEGVDRAVGTPEVDPPADAASFAVDADEYEGRFLMSGLSGEELERAGRLAPLVSVALLTEGMRETVRRQSMRDPLTRLANRMGLDDLLRRDVERAHRSGAPISVVVLDIDRLERINEINGRAAGDAAIIEAGEILRGGLRMVDVAARIGGGEFCAVLPGAVTENAREVAERLRCAIAAANIPGVGTMTATFGVASLKEHAANGVALLQAAQAAMTTGKRRGRNRVDVAVPINREY